MKTEFELLKDEYTQLALTVAGDTVAITGKLGFSATYGASTLDDEFEIGIKIPSDYPQSPPIIWETGGRIPDDYHKNFDKSLCLAVPLEIRERLSREPGLKNYVKNLVIPYLFRFSAWKTTGKFPYDDMAHGGEGIIKFYMERFRVDSEIQAFDLLSRLVEGKYPGHEPCPCGSGMITRRCHGDLMCHCQKYMARRELLTDLLHCFEYLDEKKIGISRPSKKLMNYLRKMEAKNAKNTCH